MATQSNYQYYATLNAEQVLRTLESIDKKMDGMEKAGTQSFQGISKQSTMTSSVMSGAVMGVVSSLTTKLIQLGASGVAAFGNILKSSQQAAVTFDVTKRKFTSIFEGNEAQATAVMDRLTVKATSLGMEMNEALSIARAFTPDVKGTEDPLGQLDNLLVGVRALAEEDPAQGIIGARFAIDEAMSGSLRSLKQRFEFTKAETDILKSAQEELGQVVGTIEGINAVMQRRGVDIEALKGSYTMAVGEMQAQTAKLQIQLGKPISSAMADAMGELTGILTEKGPGLQLAAAQIGEVAASIVEMIGSGVTDFLEGLDPEQLQEIGADFFELVDSARTLAEIIRGTEFEGSFLDSVQSLIDKLNEAAMVSIKISALVKAQSAKNEAEQAYLKEAGAKKVSGLGGMTIYGGSDEERAAAAEAAGQEAYNKVIEEAMQALEGHTDRVEENKEAMAERREELERDTSADLAAAEEFLKQGGPTGAAALSADDQEALTDYQTSLEESAKKLQESLADIEADGLEKREDMAIDASRKRMDIERDYMRELDDLSREYAKDVLDARSELVDDEADLLEKQAKERVKAEKASSERMLDIELDYQRSLQDIQKSFEHAQEDAIESQDAIAYYQALKQRERAKENAEQSRQENVEDAKTEAVDKAAVLREEQAQELADLKSSNAEKLAELDNNLWEQIEKQKLARQRDYEDAAIADAQKMEDLLLSEQRRVEAANAANEQKLADLKEALSEEVLAFLGAEQEKTAIALTEAQIRAQNESEISEKLARQQAMQRAAAKSEGLERYQQAYGNRGQYYEDHPQTNAHQIPWGGMVPGRASGGNVSAGLTYMVGEGGPELVRFGNAGRVIPNPDVRRMGAIGGGMQSTTNNFSPNYSLNNPAMLSPEQAIQTQKIAEQMAITVMRQLLGEV